MSNNKKYWKGVEELNETRQLFRNQVKSQEFQRVPSCRRVPW